VVLSKSQAAPGHPTSFYSGNTERGPALLRRQQETKYFPTVPDWRQSGHARCSQIVLRSQLKRVVIGKRIYTRTTMIKKNSILEGSRTMREQSHILWPLQSSSNIRKVNWGGLKRPHLRVISRVPGRHDRELPRVSRAPAQPAVSVPAVPRCPPKSQYTPLRNLVKYGSESWTSSYRNEDIWVISAHTIGSDHVSIETKPNVVL
jgi:hypothetical protein